ncbi:DNA utilization family protein [Roseateles puraquae]|uniref:Type II secretion system protein GspC N-terminal domain-containing protein n=1 Tax=Roseateles puraquae TaxID=431059 RepID=A0A254N5R4_9BURK|nr:DNA utilization family protein [Roseateles puraquae]MDG0855385.1 DUF2531 family protein [Roseateles puraquae]OWR03365.1 hypothetical protein CDO81_12745 [Roseateles puraquae]
MIGSLGARQLLTIYAAAGLLGWYAGPAEPPAEPLVQARRDAWQLVTLPLASDGTTLAVQVAGAPVWGAEAKPPAAAASAAENDRWRIAGLYGRGKQGGVLVLFQDPAKPPQRLKVGDKLPTGELIQAVEGNEVIVRKGKKVERFGVEQREK